MSLRKKSRPGPRLREPGRHDGRCTLISRILSPPSAGNDHLSSSRAKGPGGADQSQPRLLPGNIPLTRNRAGNPFSLFCLAPHGVCLAPSVTLRAVGSYPAISPLPTPAKPEWAVSSTKCQIRRYIFCDTFRQPSLSRRPPALSCGSAALWCPDFPPCLQKARRSSQAHPQGVSGEKLVFQPATFTEKWKYSLPIKKSPLTCPCFSTQSIRPFLAPADDCSPASSRLPSTIPSKKGQDSNLHPVNQENFACHQYPK